MNITEVQAKTDTELADLAKEMGILKEEDGVVPRRQDLINRCYCLSMALAILKAWLAQLGKMEKLRF